MMHRRRLLMGAAGTLVASLGSPIPALAQTLKKQRPGQATAALEARARAIGIPTPLGDAANRNAQDQDAYRELLPRLVDIIVRSDKAGGPASDVAEAAADLLARIHRAERSLAPDVLRKAPSYESVREEYRKLFDECQVQDRYKTMVDQHVETLKTYKSRYETVGSKLDIPWYFIGIIHALEAGFNFRTHLHNGRFAEGANRAGTQGAAGGLEPTHGLGIQRAGCAADQALRWSEGLEPGANPVSLGTLQRVRLSQQKGSRRQARLLALSLELLQ